jgi:hypothetical protein
MEKKQHMRWTRRGAQMLLPRALCATQRRTGQIHPVVALRIIAGAGGGRMNPQVLSGPDLSAIDYCNLNRGLPGSAVYDLRVLTQLWCTRGTCGTLAGIDDKSVISRKPLLRFEQRDASPRVQYEPGLDHGSSRSELCRLSWLPIHLALAP